MKKDFHYPVSYTHLDVYKRQIKSAASRGIYIGMVCIWGTPVEQGLMNEKEAVAYGKFLAERYRSEEHTSNSSHSDRSRMPSSA